MFGETIARGSKIYAIRAPADTSPPEITEQHRSVGIVFNWESTVGFRRAGDNARAFIFREGVRGTYGSLDKAYIAAVKFMGEPSLHEGPLPIESHATAAPNKMISLLKIPNTTTRFFLVSIAISALLFVSYNGILYLHDYMECRKNALNSFCIHLISLQVHLQTNAVKYVEIFFAQLKVGYLLVIQGIIDSFF